MTRSNRRKSKAESEVHKVMVQLKVLTLVITILGVAVAYGSLKQTVEADTIQVAAHTSQIASLDSRLVKTETAFESLPEMRADIKKLLAKMERLETSISHGNKLSAK